MMKSKLITVLLIFLISGCGVSISGLYVDINNNNKDLTCGNGGKFLAAHITQIKNKDININAESGLFGLAIIPPIPFFPVTGPFRNFTIESNYKIDIKLKIKDKIYNPVEYNFNKKEKYYSHKYKFPIKRIFVNDGSFILKDGDQTIEKKFTHKYDAVFCAFGA